MHIHTYTYAQIINIQTPPYIHPRALACATSHQRIMSSGRRGTPPSFCRAQSSLCGFVGVYLLVGRFWGGGRGGEGQALDTDGHVRVNIILHTYRHENKLQKRTTHALVHVDRISKPAAHHQQSPKPPAIDAHTTHHPKNEHTHNKHNINRYIYMCVCVYIYINRKRTTHLCTLMA